MSIMKMRRMFHRQRKIKLGKKQFNVPSVMAWVFGLLVIIFIIGAFWSFGNPSGRGGAGPTTQQQGKGPGTVVGKVAGQPVAKGQIDAMIKQQSEMYGQDVPLSMELRARLETFNSISQQLSLIAAAKQAGVRVTHADLDKELNDQAEQKLNRLYPTQEALFKALQSKNISREDLLKRLKDELAQNTEGMQEQLLTKKLQDKIEATVPAPTDPQITDWYTEVKAEHILIDPKKLMTPAPGKPGEPAPKPLTKDQADAAAKQKADALLAQIKGGADFAKLANDNTDDPGGKGKGGDLGWVKHGEMVPEFEKAAFALKPNEISPAPVKSQFGYHIIKVTEVRSTLPKDYDKNKDMYKKQVQDEMKQQVWQQYQSKLKDTTQIQITDPALRAEQALEENHDDDAKTLLAQAAQEDPQDAAVRWQLAQMMIKDKNWPGAIKNLVEASKIETAAKDPEVWMALGDAYDKSGNAKDALEAYKNASDRADAFNFQNMMLHSMLKQKFTTLKQDALVKQEDKWTADFQADQKKNPQGGPMGGMMPGGTLQVP